MARHQIIYTSCMRGIDGVNDGQQVFSYDESFKDNKSDDVKGLFTYQVPALPAGTVMSEEIAQTMPAAFMYRYLKNGTCSVTLNTYLGRDYMGSAGRFGNHLSHSIVCDFEDFNVYPCEMYASTVLRSSMEYEEVNNPDPPEYLPEPELTCGYVVDPDQVVEFLGVDDRLEYYKMMVAAMLCFQTEKRRIVICDDPGNIVMWIASLQYTLPLEIAKKINFTTYEFDPELSPAQICGVIPEGTRYHAESYVSSNRHFVFDFIRDQFNPVESGRELIDFLDTAFSFSYDSLVDFRDFVYTKTMYRECDENYYTAYDLYNLLTEGIEELSEDEFKGIVDFSSKYLTDEMKKALVFKLIEEQQAIGRLDHAYALRVLGYMLQFMNLLSADQQDIVKQMIVERLLMFMSAEEMAEADFMPLYDSIDSMARSIRLSIPSELMVPHNRDALLEMLAQKTELWKVRFVVRIISDYVKDTGVPADELYPNRSIGTVYFRIIKMSFASGRHVGYEVAEQMLDSFAACPDYYVEMALNLEEFFCDLELSNSDLAHHWEHFYDVALRMGAPEIEKVTEYLAENDRYDEMYELFVRRLEKKRVFAEAKDYFTAYWSKWFVSDAGYGQKYAAEALRVYADVYGHMRGSMPEEEQFLNAKEILRIALQMELQDAYIQRLCESVCRFIPLKEPERDDRQLLVSIYQYYRDVLQEKIDGSLLLFVIAIRLEKVTDLVELPTIVESIHMVAAERAVVPEIMGASNEKEYFDWAFGAVSEFILSADDYDDLFSLFMCSRSLQEGFMSYWCRVTFKNSKEEKDYSEFAEFLLFLFRTGSLHDQDMVGKYLCKLNKQRIEALDEELKRYFRKDRSAIRAWNHVREIAVNTNPLVNNLSSLFKRR